MEDEEEEGGNGEGERGGRGMKLEAATIGYERKDSK